MMMRRDRYILLIDGSTEVCSVALASEQSGVVASSFESAKSKQSERLAPMAHEVLSSLPEGGRLEAVVVAEGPGSYTGLRIVAGYAKGLCMALGLPLYTITTTELLAHTFLSQRSDIDEGALLIPMIDARRMEVYAGLYDHEATSLTDIKALILTDSEVQDSIKEVIGEKNAYFFGSGAEKAVELFHEWLPNAEYQPNIVPDASTMVQRAWALLADEEPQDVTYWEPFYLKEYQAKVGVPNKVLKRLQKE